MKNLIVLPVFLLLYFISCQEPPVVFEGPQPKGQFPRFSLDMMYRGTFLCDSDSAMLYVKSRLIYKEKPFLFSLTLDEIATTEGIDLVGDQLIIAEFPESLTAKVTDSLVHSSVVLRDTLFQIGDDEVLKYYKGHMVLNKRITIEKWEVKILSLDDDLNLRMSIATMPTDLDYLNEITPVKDLSTEDKEQLLLSPSYIEFEEIFKQKLIFEECDLFRRIGPVLQI